MSRRFILALLVVGPGLFCGPHATAQDSGQPGGNTFTGLDTLYREFSHPQKDAAETIKRRDFRFIALDRAHQDVPGLEGQSHLKAVYGTKIIRQHLHLFLTRSQKFSLDLRARAYAQQFNQALIDYLFKHPGKKR